MAGAGQAFFNPALTGLVPEIVSAGRLQQANALPGIALSAGQVVGPALAALIVAASGPGWAIGIDAITYAVSGWCLLRVRIPAGSHSAGGPVLSQFAGGWKEFRSRSRLWLLVVQFASFHLFSFAPFMVPGAIAARDRRGGAGARGIILAALGAGSILGGLLSAGLRPRRPLVVAALGAVPFALPVVFTALTAGTAVIAVCAGVAGASLPAPGTLRETTSQREVPAAALSRVSSYDWFGSLAFVPAGYALAGPLAVAFGIRPVLLSGAGWVLVTCAAVLAAPNVRNLTSAAASGA